MITWNEVTSCNEGGAQWEASPSNTHAIDIWPHEKEGFSWCVITDDVEDNAPEGWSATRDDAEMHAEAAYFEWIDVLEGRKPIHDEEATSLLLAELEVSLQALKEENAMLRDAVSEERAAVVAYLREEASHTGASPDERTILRWAANYIERGEHRREEKR